jgi:HlyD family secretion protein
MDPAERQPLKDAPAVPPARATREALHEFQPDIIALERNPLPRAAHLLLWTIIGFIVAAIVWAWLAEVDRVVAATGRVITTALRIVINPLVTSQIVELPVEVGRIVKKGDVLVRLDPTFARADFAQSSERAASVSAQFDRIEAEIGGRPYNGAEGEERLQADIYRQRLAKHQSTLRTHEGEIQRLESALVTNREQAVGLRENHRVLSELEAMRSKLAETQHAAKSEVLEATRRRLEAETEMKRVVNQEAELRHQLAKTRAERSTYIEDRQRQLSEELVTVKRERDANLEQVKKASRQQEFVEMRSPVDAVVLEIAQRSAGSVAKEAEPIVTLVPLDAPLEAEVEIRASDIGFVRAGQKARIKIDAFPFQRHGTLEGTVRTVTEDSFQKDERLGAVVVYRARLRFETTALRHAPENFRLIPGMTLTGEIRVGERSVLSYILYPLIQTFDEGLREP